MQVSYPLATFPVSSQACLRKPRVSFGTPKGPATGLPGLVHIGTQEATAWALVVPCRGQVRPRIQAKLEGFRVLAKTLKLRAPLARFQRTTPLQGRCSVQFCTVLKMRNEMKKTRTFLTPLALLAVTAAGTAMAQSTDPVSAIAAVTSLQGSAAGFGPVMFGLAIAVVGIMIGVKWIKRAKGAA